MAGKSEPLRRAAMLLDIIGMSREGITTAEVAAISELPLPTVHRMINSLMDIGYVKGGGGRSSVYTLGPRINRLFQCSINKASLSVLAAPVLQTVAEKFTEVAYLGQLVGNEVDLVDAVLPKDVTKALIYPGQNFPLNATALAKAIIANQSEEDIDSILEEQVNSFEEYLPVTLTSIEDVREHLKDVKQQGYAVSDSEFDSGVYAICVPISIPSVGVMYGLGIVGLKERMMSAYSKEEMISELAKAANDLAKVFATSSPL